MDKSNCLLRSETLIKRGNFSEAITALNKLIAEESKPSLATHIKLAKALELDGQLEEAIAIYEKVMTINPAHVISKSSIARIKLKQGKSQDAINIYDDAMAMVNPNPPLWLCNDWQKALRRTGNIHKAIDYYKDAIRLQPENFVVRIQLASIYKREGRNCLPAFFVQKQLFDESPHPLTIFDIGENIGETARDYNNLFSNSNIHCFEPTPEIFEQLEKNIEKDGLKSVKIHQLAVSDKRDTAKFYLQTYRFE